MFFSGRTPAPSTPTWRRKRHWEALSRNSSCCVRPRPRGNRRFGSLRGPKRTLDAKALAFVLEDFWRGTAPGSATLSLRSLMLSHAAPGAVLLLDEPGLYDKIEELCSRSRRLALAERRRRRLRPDEHGRPAARTWGARLVMADNSIASRIAIRRRYVRSVDLARDAGAPDALDGYVVTPSVREAAVRLVAGLSSDSRQRAFRVVGPYGAGKSAFGVFVAQFFRDRGDGPASRLFAEAAGRSASAGAWTPVILTGRRVSFARELLRAVAGDGGGEGRHQRSRPRRRSAIADQAARPAGCARRRRARVGDRGGATGANRTRAAPAD